MADLKQEFWDRIEDVRAGMLGVEGHGRLVPMSPNVDDDMPGHVWFITAKDTELGRSVATGPKPARFVVSDDNAGLYGDIDGTLSLWSDEGTLDEVWSAMDGVWFEKGREDPDVRLMKFTPASGEISATPTGGAKMLYEMAKAKLTDATPDVGAQGVVTF